MPDYLVDLKELKEITDHTADPQWGRTKALIAIAERLERTNEILAEWLDEPIQVGSSALAYDLKLTSSKI